MKIFIERFGMRVLLGKGPEMHIIKHEIKYVLPAVLILVFLVNPAAGQQLLAPPPRIMPSDLPMQTILYEAEQLAAAKILTIAQLKEHLALQSIFLTDEGMIHVEIIAPKGSEALPESVIAAYRGIVDNSWRHRVSAWIPIQELTNIARVLPEGYFMERANVTSYDQVAGEGPGVINSDSYRNGGANGTGMTIAVIDGDYSGLTAARNNGDAPPTGSTTEINYTSDPFEDDNTHGTGCVEAAFDHCPGATWRLYKIDDLTDFGNAVDNCISNNVDVITHSLSRYNLGWEDNSGDACDAATDAANAGMLFFTSAGNRAEQHWQGDYSPGSGSTSWHDWVNGDETIDIVIDNGRGGNFYLAWDTDGGTYDYDLYLYDNTLTEILASSTNGGNTYEEFTWVNLTGAAQTVHLAVYRNSGGVTEFEVFLHGSGTWQEHIVSEGSTTSPSNATHSNVISNGAVDWTDFSSPNGTSGIIMDYSSRGPGNSGMTLPNVCGPTNTTGFTYWLGFGGTSCATPNNAGAACAFWSADPLLSASSIRWLMFEQAALWKDWGDSGNDNIYGRGGTILLDYEPNTLWIARSYGNISNFRSAPFYTVQAAHDAAIGGGRLLIFPGGNYPEPATLYKELMVETVEYIAILGQ